MERRTAFFDAETLRAIERGTPQVVIVAAGYDGRALRFASPRVRWFEVDHPATQADKRRRLAAAGVDPSGVTFVSVDLTKDDLVAALRGAGHDATRPSLFVVEGLFGYLTRPVSRQVLSSLRELAVAGSRLAAAFPTLPGDASPAEKLRLRLRGVVVAMAGEPWLVRFGPHEPDELLEATRWSIAPSERQGGGLVRYEGRQGVLIGAVPA
jgi:methyltransferase (TIGR00027 family)